MDGKAEWVATLYCRFDSSHAPGQADSAHDFFKLEINSSNSSILRAPRKIGLS
jgi:hypothetical protein